MTFKPFSRRDFLKTAIISLGGLAILPSRRDYIVDQAMILPEFPQAERLGRVLDGRVKVKVRPDEDSPTVSELSEDTVVVWLRELVGKRLLWTHQRFVEIPEGYIYAPNLQPVYNQPNLPLTSLPNPDGMWVVVTVPYIDLTLANPPPRSPWLKYTPMPRLYYSQIMWVDQIKSDEQNQVWYRTLEKYGSFGDIFWVPGSALRPIADDEISPINPEAGEKLVVVNVNYQTLSCYEGQNEVYFCRISTGGKFDSDGNASDKWATPLGRHTIWRKMVSVHMTGGTTGGGYDLPGIGWTTLFSGKGMAIHSTFWHNSFGVPMSHGCVNAAPEEAKWIFRWTLPVTQLYPGDVVISGQGSTRVLVEES
jgi:hypothetical protein